MPLYSFKCKVCESPKEFTMTMKDAPKVGTSIRMTDQVCPEQDVACECGANNWTRTWPHKMGGFRMNMRRTPLV